MLRSAVISVLFLPGLIALAADRPDIHVNASMPGSPRQLEPQTERAAVRDYLQSWKAMDTAFQQNRAGLLAQDFVGEAQEQLSNTIREQSALGIHTHYQDLSHDIHFLFYSPEGMSIEFTDVVKVKVQVFDSGRLVSSTVKSTRYLVVMTPAEVRWSIRVLQGIQA